MSKLTEIKRDYEASKLINENCTTIPMSWYGYLLSLLEEKDKALEFYADKETWNKPGVDQSEIARKALNTSSNNEGDK